jgi:DNA-binding transcriptional MerR regulator
MAEKKYISIDELSKLLNINKHVIRYWDSKFDGISTRLNNNKQRFFNVENIKKIKNLQKILYQDGKPNYSLDLAKKIINAGKSNLSKSSHLRNDNSFSIDYIKKLENISKNLKNLIIL